MSSKSKTSTQPASRSISAQVGGGGRSADPCELLRDVLKRRDALLCSPMTAQAAREAAPVP